MTMPRGRGRRFVQPDLPAAEPGVDAPAAAEAPEPAGAPAGRWRRTSVGVPDRTGAYSTTIRFTEERYRWLHQVAGTTGQSKSELVDAGLELLAERMGYGARPV